MDSINLNPKTGKGKITKESLLNVINTMALLIYSTLVALEFRRYISSNPSSSLIDLFLALEVLLAAICLIKIIIFFPRKTVYSISSILIIGLSVYFHLFKFNYEWRFFLTTMPYLLTLSLLMVSMYQIPFDRIIKTFLITVATLFVIRILGATTKVLPSERYNIGSRTDIWDLGFGHYNTPLMYFFFICLAWIYSIRSKTNYILDALSIGLFTIILYKFTTSRTATFVLLLGVLALIILSILNIKYLTKIRNILLQIFRLLMASMPVLIAVISFGGTILLNYIIYNFGFPSVWSTFFERFVNFNDDCAMNGVFLPWNYYAGNFTGVSYNWFFGGVSQSQYSDNLIQSILINYGIVVLLLYTLIMTIWAVKSVKDKNDINLLIIGLISLLSTMQPHAILYGWNPFLMLPFAVWGACEPEIKKVNSISLISFKNAIKEFINKITDRSSKIIPLLFIYLVVSMGFMVVVAYQLVTNVVSDYFFWWMIITVYVLFFFDMIINSSIKTNASGKKSHSLKKSLRIYGPRIAIIICFLIVGSLGIMSTVLKTSTSEFEINDTRIKEDTGLTLNIHPSYRQVFRLDKSGLKKISIYLKDYSKDTAEFGLSFVTTNGANGIADVYNPSDYEDKSVIEIDTSSGSFKAGDVIVLSLFDIDDGSKNDPVLERISYTFVNDVNYKGCAIMAIPVIIGMFIAWFAESLRYKICFSSEDE